MDESRQLLYVASSVGKEVIEFKFDSDNDNNNLHLVKRMDLQMAPDNLSWRDGGGGENVLVVAGHPKLLQYTFYSKDPHSKTAPCSVALIDVNSWSSERIYEQEGAFSGCSVGTMDATGTLFIGAVYERHSASDPG